MEAQGDLESQLQAMQAQKEQVEALLPGLDAASAAGLQPLLGQLEDTIKALEEEIFKQKKGRLLSMLSSMKEEEKVGHAPAAQGEGGEGGAAPHQEWEEGQRVVVRRWNGAWADATIEEIDSEGGTCLLSWLHPRSKSELLCRYWKQGTCKWGDRCSSSHGDRWKLEDLHPYEGEARQVWAAGPPQEGDEVLAKDVDDVWYEGVIEEVLDGSSMASSSSSSSTASAPPLCMVRFNRKNRMGGANSETTAVEGDEQHMLPLHHLENLVPRSQRRNQRLVVHDEDEDEAFESVRVLGAVSGDPDEIFSWAKYSKGVGLRLLQRMGYRLGEGLGQGKRGRAEPVEIRVYPPGVSLDFIHEGVDGAKGKVPDFREGGGEDEDDSRRAAKVRRKSVFEVINQAVGRRGEAGGGKSEEEQQQMRSAANLHKKEEGELRVDLINEMDKRRQIQSQLGKLHEMLARNESKDPGFAAQIRERIGTLEGRLQSSDAHAEKMRAAASKKRDERKRSKDLF